MKTFYFYLYTLNIVIFSWLIYPKITWNKRKFRFPFRRFQTMMLEGSILRTEKKINLYRNTNVYKWYTHALQMPSFYQYYSISMSLFFIYVFKALKVFLRWIPLLQTKWKKNTFSSFYVRKWREVEELIQV